MNAYNIKVSNREAEILQLMSDGFTSKEIGVQLYISNLTVDKHKRNMLTKFNARNAVQLVVNAERMGIISDQSKYLQDDILSNIVSQWPATDVFNAHMAESI